MTSIRLAVLIAGIALSSHAHAFWKSGGCDHASMFCGNSKGRSTSAPSRPSVSSGFNINPSAVPVEKGFGAETIFFKSEWDFSLVRGLGRVGAAISPSNNEESFFGPPGFELPEDLFRRKMNQEKYPSQKVTLATAFKIYDNKQKGLKRFDLLLGVVGKYNKATQSGRPGGGLSGVVGPFTYGYSIAADQFQLDYAPYGIDRKETIEYFVETWSAGLFLSNVALDYSVLRQITTELSTVSVATLSYIGSKTILTVSNRTEESDRPAFNYQKLLLESQRRKTEWFGGAQYGVTKNVMLGAFYNYYLLREISLGATLFF